MLKGLGENDDGSMGSEKSGPSRKTNFLSSTGNSTNCLVNTTRLAQDHKSRTLENTTLKAKSAEDRRKAGELKQQHKLESQKSNDLEKQLEALKAQLAAQTMGSPTPSGSAAAVAPPPLSSKEDDGSATAQG